MCPDRKHSLHCRDTNRTLIQLHGVCLTAGRRPLVDSGSDSSVRDEHRSSLCSSSHRGANKAPSSSVFNDPSHSWECAGRYGCAILEEMNPCPDPAWMSCRYRLIPPAVTKTWTESKTVFLKSSQEGWAERSGLWSAPARPFPLFGVCPAHLLPLSSAKQVKQSHSLCFPTGHTVSEVWLCYSFNPVEHFGDFFFVSYPVTVFLNW